MSVTRLADNRVSSSDEEEDGECQNDEEEEKGEKVHSEYGGGGSVVVGEDLVLVDQLTLGLVVVGPGARQTGLISSSCEDLVRIQAVTGVTTVVQELSVPGQSHGAVREDTAGQTLCGAAATRVFFFSLL